MKFPLRLEHRHQEQLTEDIYNDYYPMINDSGHVTWLTDATTTSTTTAAISRIN